MLRGALQGLLGTRPAARTVARLPGRARPADGVPRHAASADLRGVPRARAARRGAGDARSARRRRSPGRRSAVAAGAPVLPGPPCRPVHRARRGPRGTDVRVCSPHCGIDPETTSGGETYEREILRHLAAGGMAIEILLARHKRYPEGVPNWTIRRLPIGRGLRWPIAPFVMAPAVKRAWDAHPFDLLRAHSLRYVGPATLIARRRYRLGVPIVAHHHHLDPSPINRFVEGPVMRAVERVVVGSRFAARQAAAELGVPAERFAIVPYGVDDRFPPAPRPAALARDHGLEGKTVVLFLGGLKPRKNLFLLLDVWRRVAQERDDARLVIAGDGPLRERLREHAGALARDGRVVFTGYVPEAEKASYYNMA